MKTTEISKEIKTQAEIEGQRIFDNNQKRNRPSYQKRDNELEIDILGAMGELAVCEVLLKNKRVYKRNKSEVNYPVKESDIIVDGNITIDVKAVASHSHDWYINKKAFLDTTKNKSDFYWMIKFVDNTNVYYEIFTKDEVSKWKTRQSKYTEVLYANYKGYNA